MSKKNKYAISRRDILRGGLLTAGAYVSLHPLSAVIHAIAKKSAFEAHAATLKDHPLRYIYIQEFGAPPRHFYDLILNPGAGVSPMPHPMLANRYKANGGRYTEGEFATVKIKGYNMPYIWGQKTSASGRNISELADHMMVIQGVHGVIDGHPFNAVAHTLPVDGGHSLGGLVAENSGAFIRAVSLGPASVNYGFNSLKGASILVSTPRGQALVDQLLRPFTFNPSAAYKQQISAVEERMSEAIRSLSSLNQRNQGVLLDHENAKKLMKEGVDNYLQSWQPLYAKYNQLIKDAIVMDGSLPGINDLPVGTEDTTSRGAQYWFNNSGQITNKPDIRDAVVAQTTVDYMAENFATAEFLLTQNYTHSLRMAMGSTIVGANLLNTANQGIGNDQHGVGAIVGILFNTLYRRALSACLLEFIDQLKATSDPVLSGNMFDNSLIHLAGEFNRITRILNSGAVDRGTDHGWEGISATFFSGRIPGLHILGNILKSDTARGGERATWGHAADVEGLGQPLQLAHIVNSAAAILNVQPLVTSGNSIVSVSQGSVTPLIPKAKLIDNT